jgi:hypothetical protein
MPETGGSNPMPSWVLVVILLGAAVVLGGVSLWVKDHFIQSASGR